MKTVKDIKITEHINTHYRDYAIYVLENEEFQIGLMV